MVSAPMCISQFSSAECLGVFNADRRSSPCTSFALYLKVKGYGTRLMNCLKQAARDHDKLTRLLTFADNKATAFFAKNGFSQNISIPRDFYAGYLKEYEFAAPMECFLLKQANDSSIAQWHIAYCKLSSTQKSWFVNMSA